MEVARIVSFLWDDIAQREQVIASHLLSRRNGDREWQRGQGLEIDDNTDIIDLFVIEAETRLLLLLTDSQGFFASRDDGVTWEDFNHGEGALLNGNRLRPVITGTPGGVYVLAITANDSDAGGTNRLFRFHRRNWRQRLRAGLVELLRNPAET